MGTHRIDKITRYEIRRYADNSQVIATCHWVDGYGQQGTTSGDPANLQTSAKGAPHHTPGPWHIGAGNGAGAIFSDEGRMLLTEAGGTTLFPIATVCYGYRDDEDEANAHLIAAAPDLLAALKDLLDQADETYPHFESPRGTANRMLARAAIEKATLA